MESQASTSGAPRGALIVFEGIDRCGKTTQCGKLVEHLQSQGVDAQLWRFPDRTTDIGNTINDYLANKSNLDDAVIHLLFVANRFEKRSEMLRLLASGVTLVVDRYSYSGIAYTAAKGVPHLGASYCRSLEAGLPAADLVVYMDISPEASAARGGYGGERYEKMEFQAKVVQQFRALEDSRWARIDAVGDIESIHRQVAATAMPAVQKAVAGMPLTLLWPQAGTCVPVRARAGSAEEPVDAEALVSIKAIAAKLPGAAPGAEEGAAAAAAAATL